MSGVWLEDLTWPEARAWFDRGAVVLVPIGAASKEHGRHLPLKTDLLLARAFADEVRKALPVVVAPVVCFGYYPAFRHYPGSQHLSPETFQALVTEILEGFLAQGATKLAILNTGVSTEPCLRIVVRELYQRARVRVPVADIRNRTAKTVVPSTTLRQAVPGSSHAIVTVPTFVCAVPKCSESNPGTPSCSMPT
jgi:creatinine amidohydrolase